MLELHGIEKSFEDQMEFQKISVSLPDAGIVLLFGESGSGKTTFLNILAGQMSFDEGYVIWREVKYEQALPDSLGGEAEYITQDPFFVDFLNVEDNLNLLGRSDKQSAATLSQNQELMKRLGLGGKEEAYPGTLSGGEKQRLSFVRALIKGRRILLLDEPTAALDVVNKTRLFELIKELSKDMLVVMASHDPAAKKYADGILLFNKEKGTVLPDPLTDSFFQTGHEVRKKEETLETGLPDSETENSSSNSPKEHSLSYYLRKWFHSSSREKSSRVRFVVFLVIALLLCSLADTPAHKNAATMANLYKLNCLKLTVQGNHEIEEVLPEDPAIKEVVIHYNGSCPDGAVPSGTGMFILPDYESNLYVLPDDENLFSLKDKILYGTYFTGPNQILLMKEMAAALSPRDPAKIVGKTISKKLYGLGQVNFTIAGVLDELNDAERIYLNNNGAQTGFADFKSVDIDKQTYFVSAATIIPLIQDPAFYSGSGGRQRVWYLYFDSYKFMSRFYETYKEDLNRSLDDDGGRVMLDLQGIPLEYSMSWPLISVILLPLSALMILLTVLFFVGMKRTELAYNNRFIAVFEYAGYEKKAVIRRLILLSLCELLGQIGLAACLAFLLTLVGNAINYHYFFLPLQLFTYNLWILGGFFLSVMLFAWLYLHVSFRKIETKSWYELLRQTRDLL